MEFSIAGLDSERNAREFMSSMKRPLSILLTLCATEIAIGQVVQNPTNVTKEPLEIRADKSLRVPAATMEAVQSATQTLGNNILNGNFSYAVEKMYPRYRSKQEKLHGRMDAKKIELDMSTSLNNMGVTITSFTAEKPIGVFKVWQQIKPSVKLRLDQGIKTELKASDVFHNWLFIVPTTQVWTFASKKGGPPRRLKREGFQIAVAQETPVAGQETWTFIDGASMTTQDLRSVFPSLPVRLVLPERSDSEVK